MPAAMSKMKWLPVATTASPIVGPHISAMPLAIGLRRTDATAIPIATAKPTCRLGTAASWL